jgi:stress-induced morphogen
MILKQYTEQIFTDIHVRITNNLHQQQQKYEGCTTNITVVVLMTD